MPLLPQLYLNQKPVLLMIRPTQKTDHAVLELRLWAAATHFKNSSTPLWVGTLQYHMPPHKLMALTRKQRSHYATENALSQLRETLATAHFASRYVPLPPPQHHKQNPHDGTKILQVRAAHNMLDTLRQ